MSGKPPVFFRTPNNPKILTWEPYSNGVFKPGMIGIEKAQFHYEEFPIRRLNSRSSIDFAWISFSIKYDT